MRRQVPVLAVLALLFLHGCAGHRPAPPPETSLPAATVEPAVPSEAPAAEPSVTAPPEVPAPPPAAAGPGERAYAAGAAAMAEAHYERALEQFAAAWKENPDTPAVARDFPEALEGLKRAGDEALRQGRSAEAGKRWEAVLRHIGHPAAKGKPLSFTKADVQQAVDKLTASLMEKGLVEYRKGNLEAAIAHWRTILSYHPSHAEAARSIQTATTQLENLKKIPPPK